MHSEPTTPSCVAGSTVSRLGCHDRIGDATFAHLHTRLPTRIRAHHMALALSQSTTLRGSRRIERAWRRPAAAGARSWTGRSALSSVTDSALPHLVTSGTHRTRVSEMRLAARRADRPLVSLHAQRARTSTAPAARPRAQGTRGLPSRGG